MPSRAGSGRGGGVRLARLEEPALLALQADRGERPGAVGAGIEGDPVGMLLRPLDDGVAVDDDDAMVAPVVEEAFADPAEVATDLLVERHAGADPGMDEQIIAEAEAVVHPVEE